MRFALVLILPALFAGRAATASNVIPAVPVGSGAGEISGFTVASVSYSVAQATIDGVSFTISPAVAATVKARLATTEPWTDCVIAGATVSCPVATSAAAAESLEVVAAG